MKYLAQQIIEKLINSNAFINDYPKPGVVFLAMNALFNDPDSRKIVVKAVCKTVDADSFDAVAGIASRGLVFSGRIADHFSNKGEDFIEKVKVKGDPHYDQIDTTTEYSSDSLQVLKGSIQEGKRYLLTDDLVATGGSLLSAIKLIRECGGIVDKVFVMTELLDFKAREMLQQEGVELMSLLSFTGQDLQKLLNLQECYNANNNVPLTYKLSQHEKGSKALTEMNGTNMQTVLLASTSAIKSEAVKKAFKGLFDPLDIKLISKEAVSGVGEQPFGHNQTKVGAKNRINSIKESAEALDSDVLVAIENGLRFDKTEKTYYDFVHVMLECGGKSYAYTQDCCKVPESIVDAIRKDKQGNYVETWGDVAKRKGLAKNSKNPHQEEAFGGISRNEHLFKAMCSAFAEYKKDVLKEDLDLTIDLNRMVNINNNKFNKKYAKRGIFFNASQQKEANETVDLYNHGCPTSSWGISSEVTKRTTFKVFSTGDAFSIITPEAKIADKDININVGVEHEKYSPLVLLQEALQLTRCAYEHGVANITVSLPESFHPGINPSDFNLLLMRLFKASGANQLYYYDQSFRGKLDQSFREKQISLSGSEHQEKLVSFLDLENQDAHQLDKQMMLFTKRDRLQRAWDKFNDQQHDLNDQLTAFHLPEQLKIPAIGKKPHVVLSCSANKPLAAKIAQNLKQRGEDVIMYDIDGEAELASIPLEASICGAKVTIVQSTRPNPDHMDNVKDYQVNGAANYFFESALIAREAQQRGAKEINLINPYQYSARSDKAENNHFGRTGSYVQQNGRLLEVAGITKVVTAECHDVHTLSGSYTAKKINGFQVPGLEIMSANIAKDWVNQNGASQAGQLRLVAPDAGATKRTKELTNKLQNIIGNKLSSTRILGDKQRDSHSDTSAKINSLSTGDVAINAQDKYLITDDETATGSTLCQAIANLAKQGASDIAVAVVHNNMPLDWLERQLCLARFIYMGVNDLHFSDTQEMGRLTSSYSDLIAHYAEMTGLSEQKVEEKLSTWFAKNIQKNSSFDADSYNTFKDSFSLIKEKVKIHSLAAEFAAKVTNKPVLNNLVDGSVKHFGLFGQTTAKPAIPEVKHESMIAMRK